MSVKRIQLTFPQDLIKEPVMFMMAKEFDVMPNIRRARVTETVGEMTLELEATDEILAKAIAYLESKGIKAESSDGASDI
ncbi:MAG: ABC-type methionine transport system ATPase subunit [Candidatus Omnitrophota bacterium]|jgi:ABC-type methionine transport system ATPase subunit